MNDARELRFLVEQPPSLPVRLWRELKIQTREFSANPGGYVRSSMANDAIGRKRTKSLMFGLSIGFIIIGGFVGFSFALWWLNHHGLDAKADTKKDDLTQLTMVDTDVPKIDLPKKDKRAGGGGGGGKNEPTPASKGRLPKASLTDPIVAPTTHPSPIEHPSLPVAPTIQVNPQLIPPQNPNMPIGLPTGVVGPPSDGPGSGGGIGSGKGGGIGPGDGTGYGPGHGKGTGGGEYSEGGGDGDSGPITSKLQLLSNPRPDYTEEARKNKITGTVLVEATFRADGKIAGARVVRGLGYGLDEKAIEAVMKISFRPAERNGKPVSIKQNIKVSFTLL
ncbi:MAG TPA: TonB family protein [Blastocatellia bacterium]|nr:TonB family protein [Blastocatellia bacterium]